jgi:Asp-tRNA(Asn)/Glu-tRNA(Gln) amidotransferase A subunit family amidase
MHGKHNDCTSHRATLGDWYEWISCFDVRKRTLGVARNLLDMRSSPRASAEVIKSAELLNLVGTNIVDIEAPLCNDPLLIRALVSAESRYDDILKIMNASPLDIPEEKRANMLLKYMLLDEGTTLHNARCIRNMHAQNMERLLSGMDWFICPTVYDDSSPSPALSSLSLAGICGITIPCGSTVEGHRLGLLFISRQFSESNQLGLCNYLERSNNMLKGVPRRGRHCKIQN